MYAEVAHNVSTHPRVLYMRNSLDITPYIDAAVNKVSALRMPEEYTAAIYRASGEVNQALSDVMNMAAMKQMKEASNAVYQEVSGFSMILLSVCHQQTEGRVV